MNGLLLFNHWQHHATRALATVRDATLAMLYPMPCRVCGEMISSWRDGIACNACWQEIETQPADSCAKCGLPLPSLPANIQINERRCGRCEELAFAHARACGRYDGALRESVVWLKSHPQLAPRLCDLLRETFRAAPALHTSESIIPVPLHPSRLAERTFNQAEVIAHALAAVTGLPVDAASLARVKQTVRHRAGMDARERARSLTKAFQVRAPRLIADRTVLVVDDVMTTASTAQEIAATLLNGGARAVNVLTLARVNL
jgi:ComF family protein